VGPTNNHHNTAKSYEADTMQLDGLHFKKIDSFHCMLLA